MKIKEINGKVNEDIDREPSYDDDDTGVLAVSNESDLDNSSDEFGVKNDEYYNRVKVNSMNENLSISSEYFK